MTDHEKNEFERIACEARLWGFLTCPQSPANRSPYVLLKNLKLNKNYAVHTLNGWQKIKEDLLRGD